MLIYKMYKWFIVTILLSHGSAGDQKTHNFTAYLLNMEPYVWKQDDEAVGGIIPQQLKIFTKKCENIIINVIMVSWSLVEMKAITKTNNPMELLRAKEGFNETLTGNIIVGAHNYDQITEPISKSFIALPIVHSKGLAGIVHRDTIGLGIKLYEAMFDSVLIIYNGLLLAAVVGVLLWWVERKSNPEMFPIAVGHGILNGIWWGVVTMATVGYGDIVPRTKLGKMFGIIYMLLATLLIAALTSVFTERVANGDIKLKDKKMSVVNGTWDLTIAKRYQKHSDVEKNIIKTTSYMDALERVQNKEVYATLIDYNVGAWHQDAILKKDLRFTKYIKQEFDLHIYVYENHHQNHDAVHAIHTCFEKAKQYNEYHIENYVQPITFIRLDMLDMQYALTTLGITPVISSIALFTFFNVFTYICYQRLTQKPKKQTIIMSDVLAERDHELTLQYLEKKLDERLKSIKSDILSDYRELIEDNNNNMFDNNIELQTERSEIFILQ